VGRKVRGSGIKDTGHHGGDRRRYHETHHRLKICQYRYPHHAVTATGSELLVKWVLAKTSGIKAGVQVVLIK